MRVVAGIVVQGASSREISGRSRTGKFLKVANQMRLVVVPARMRNLDPIGVWPAHGGNERLIETLNSSDHLGRQPDECAKIVETLSSPPNPALALQAKAVEEQVRGIDAAV